MGLMVIPAIVDRIAMSVKVPFTVALVVTGAAIGALRANLAPTLLLDVPGLLISTALIGTILYIAGGGGGRGSLR